MRSLVLTNKKAMNTRLRPTLTQPNDGTMNNKQKLGYIPFGAGIMLVGIPIGAIARFKDGKGRCFA